VILPQEPMSKRAEEERRMVSLRERLWFPVVTSPVIIFGYFWMDGVFRLIFCGAVMCWVQ